MTGRTPALTPRSASCRLSGSHRESKYASDVIGYNRAEHDWPASDKPMPSSIPALRATAWPTASRAGAVLVGRADPGLSGAAAGTVAAKAVIAKRNAEQHDLTPTLPHAEVQQASYNEPVDDERPDGRAACDRAGKTSLAEVWRRSPLGNLQ